MATPEEMRDRMMELLRDKDPEETAGQDSIFLSEVEVFLGLRPDPHEALRHTLANGNFEELLDLLPNLPNRDFVHSAIARLVELVSTTEEGWELFEKAKYPLDYEAEFDRLVLAKLFTLAKTKKDYREIYLVSDVGSSIGHNCLAKIKELIEQEGGPS